MASRHHSRMPPQRMHEKLRCPVWEPKRRLGVDQPQQRIDTQTTQNLSVSKIPKYYCTKEKCERDGLGKVRFKFSRMSAFCITDILHYFYHGNCQIL